MLMILFIFFFSIYFILIFETRQYWLECFEESLDKFVSQAIKSQPNSPDAPARAQKFKEKYVNRLQYLKQHPW